MQEFESQESNKPMMFISKGGNVLQTIGYEGITLPEFLELLRENDVKTLIDVRMNPLSRKKGFSKSALSVAVEARGICYVHLRLLGCPKPVRETYRESKDWHEYTAGYLAHLHSQTETIQELHGIVLKGGCCLLCFEADANQCHRSIIADQLASRQLGRLKVHHIKTAATVLEQAA